MFGSSNNASGGGLFGANSNPAGSNSGGMFGTAKPATSFGASNNTSNAFGASSTNSNTPSGGLFGNAPSNNAFGSNSGASQAPGGGLFGGAQNTANANSGATGGLFGAKPAAPSTGGGLFGSSGAANSSTNAPGGLFGSNNSTSNTNSSNTAGSLFGGSAQNNASTNSTTSGGLFGSKPAASSGGLLGSQLTNQAPSGGLFGSNSNPSQPSGGLFSSASNNNASNSLFGGNQQQQQPASTPSGGLFGQKSTNNAQPSFGWNSTAQQSSNQPSSTGTLNFGSNALSLNAAPVTSQGSASTISNTYTPAINDQIIKIKEQWDPKSPKGLLRTHFYNKVSDNEVHLLNNQQRPENESPEEWDTAMSNRPSAQSYPVKITSFTEVAQRIEVQLEHVVKSRILLNAINEKQTQLSSKHDLDNTTRILQAKARHTKLSRRLLRLATILAILKLKGYPLLPEEEEISKQFELLNSKLNDPNGSLGKLNDVFARLAILKERSEDLAVQFDSTLSQINGGLNTTTSSENGTDVHGNDNSNTELIGALSKLLYKQQIGLNYLNDVVEKDLEKVNKVSS